MNERMSYHLSLIFIIGFILIALVNTVAGTPSGLVLRNKFGSNDELLNSQYSPNLEFYEGPNAANRKYVPGALTDYQTPLLSPFGVEMAQTVRLPKIHHEKGLMDRFHISGILEATDTHFEIKNSSGDCKSIGTWNVATKTCTLTTNVGETIQIDSNGITLNGNGHTITGSNTGTGIYLPSRNGVTIKNLNVKQFVFV